MMRSDFVAFILTHGRAGSVITDKTLRKCGYTGSIVYVIDNEDRWKIQPILPPLVQFKLTPFIQSKLIPFVHLKLRPSNR